MVLGIALISHRRANPPQSDFVREMLEAVDPARATVRYRLLHRLVAPALAGALMLVAWPAAVFIKVREMVAGRPDEPEAAPEPVVFGVTRDDLLREMTRRGNRDSGDRQRPAGCGAVPAVRPSQRGVVEVRSRDWRRATRSGGLPRSGTGEWGAREIREGYVIVRSDDVGAHFETARRIVDSPASGSSQENP